MGIIILSQRLTCQKLDSRCIVRAQTVLHRGLPGIARLDTAEGRRMAVDFVVCRRGDGTFLRQGAASDQEAS